MPEETIEMTKKALHRLRAVEAVAEGRLKQGPAAEQLGVTMRQMKRLVAAYRRDGAAGLVSRRGPWTTSPTATARPSASTTRGRVSAGRGKTGLNRACNIY